MNIKQTIIATAAILMMASTASAQYKHGLAPNEDNPKPTVFHRERPLSFSAEKVFEGINSKSQVYYDAKTGAEYEKNLQTGEVTLTLREKVNGTDGLTLYKIDDKAKTYSVLMQKPFKTKLEPTTSKRTQVWQGRWCDVSDDGKWYTDMETGIVLYEKCDYSKYINIKLGEQDTTLFKIPSGYKKVESSEKALFDMMQGKVADNPKIQEMMKKMEQMKKAKK